MRDLREERADSGRPVEGPRRNVRRGPSELSQLLELIAGLFVCLFLTAVKYAEGFSNSHIHTPLPVILP